MLFFLILSPYMTFTALAYVATLTDSLMAAALVSLAINAIDHLRGRTPKAIGLVSTAIMAALAIYFVFAQTEWSRIEIGLAFDLGILAVALISIALRSPFTLQYARETADAAVQAEPDFVKVNYVLTAVWAAAMALMMAVDVLAIYVPSVPLWAGFALTLVLRTGAVQFTKWYPTRFRPDTISFQA
jgi:hypothetical protein